MHTRVFVQLHTANDSDVLISLNNVLIKYHNVKTNIYFSVN